MISDNLRESVQEARKRHQKPFSTFEIKVPTADSEIIKWHSLSNFDANDLEMNWCKFKGGQQKRAYEILKNNFEIEVCDLIEYKKFPAVIYLLAAHELNPGFTLSKRCRWVGIVSVGDRHAIEWCWLHPYLRGASIMKTFLVFYATQIHCLIVSPPITDKMINCLNSVNKFITSDQILRDKVNDRQRDYLQYSLPTEEFSSYSKENITRTFSAFQNLLMDDDFMNLPVSERRIIMSKCIESQKELLKSPELMEELRNDPATQQLVKDLYNKRDDIIKFGRL